MKLSEAIREGCVGTRKIKHDLFLDKGHGVIGACVLGAAYLGRFKRLGFKDPLQVLIKAFPALRATKVMPLYPGLPAKVQDIVMRLNDEEDYTRGEIASWLEGEGF